MSTAKWSNDTNGTKWLKLPSISESLKGTCLMIYDVCICQHCCSQTKSEMADAALKSVAWKRMQYFCFLGYSTWQAQLFVEPATIKLLFSGQKIGSKRIKDCKATLGSEPMASNCPSACKNGSCEGGPTQLFYSSTIPACASNSNCAVSLIEPSSMYGWATSAFIISWSDDKLHPIQTCLHVLDCGNRMSSRSKCIIAFNSWRRDVTTPFLAVGMTVSLMQLQSMPQQPLLAYWSFLEAWSSLLVL